MNKITKIEVQKKNKNRVNIYVDEEYVFSCDAELIYSHRLKLNDVLDLEVIKNVVYEDNYMKAKRDALRIIERSYKTQKEIYKKLQIKGYEEKIIERVIKFLDNYNFVNDKRYVDAYVNDKIATHGKDKIYYTLTSKGVDEEIIKQKLESIDEELEFEGAKKLAIKKYNSIVKREEDHRKIALKLKQYLASKGYSWELIQRVSKQVLKNEDLDS